MQLLVEVDQAVDRRQDDADIQHEREQVVGFDDAVEDQQHPAADHYYVVQVAQKVDHRMEAGHDVVGGLLGGAKIVVRGVKLLLFYPFVGVGFHFADALYRVFDGAVDLSHGLADLPEAVAHPPAEQDAPEQHEGKGDQ